MILDEMWENLSRRLKDINSRVIILENREQAIVARFKRTLTLAEANAEIPNMGNNIAYAYITDGVPEGGSSPGTGVNAYYDPNNAQWQRDSDNAAVTT